MSHILGDDAAGALFGNAGPYRYALWRVWDRSLPRCVFVMLNPSTADHEQLDPTVRRCIGFARAWGFGSLYVLNLFALRSTDPRALYTDVEPVGAANDYWIREYVRAANVREVVCAWGVHGALNGRGAAVRSLLESIGVQPMCLGVTKDRYPRHPLYLAASTRPVRFAA